MFTDRITIKAAAGAGGNGVARWRREKFKPLAGPAGGNGGRGGDIYVRAVRDISLLGVYNLGPKEFTADGGGNGESRSKAGKDGKDLVIDLPVGCVVRDLARGQSFELLHEGETVRLLKGGAGGLGNEHFKSPVNRSPERFTMGKPGEKGAFLIELRLIADVGLVGLPNAGKSTLLNALTNARSKVGAYPFTTLHPQLGEFGGRVLADIPGLMEGAAAGKGLGHEFLRHISRTHTLLHLIAADSSDLRRNYYTIRTELSLYEKSLLEKDEWIIFTKMDLVDKEIFEVAAQKLDINHNRVFFISAKTGVGMAELRAALAAHLSLTYNGATR
jgi:GTP-binding protein